MASIALRNIRFIDYLAYGSIFTRAMFQPQKKLMFFPARKAVDARWEVVGEHSLAASHLHTIVGSLVALADISKSS